MTTYLKEQVSEVTGGFEPPVAINYDGFQTVAQTALKSP